MSIQPLAAIHNKPYIYIYIYNSILLVNPTSVNEITIYSHTNRFCTTGGIKFKIIIIIQDLYSATVILKLVFLCLHNSDLLIVLFSVSVSVSLYTVFV